LELSSGDFGSYQWPFCDLIQHSTQSPSNFHLSLLPLNISGHILESNLLDMALSPTPWTGAGHLEDEKFAEALQPSRSRFDRWEWTCCQMGYTHVYCTCNCALNGIWHPTDHVVCHLAWTLGLVSQSSSRTNATQLGCQPIGHRPALASDKLARPMARSGSFQAAERGRRLDRRDAFRVVRQQ
jgi:hypothetical protein